MASVPMASDRSFEAAVSGMDVFRLLVVEDDSTQRQLLEHLLRLSGYAVETAASGEEALAKLTAGQYQILLTDWEMPGMDGATLCRRVREANLPHYLYILMLTANTSTAHVVAGLDAGADDYLCKPANQAELMARLNSGRRVVQLEQSLREANARIQHLSITDPLVGTFNRRYLSEQLELEFKRALRHGRPLTLALADLDHFKKINDQYGHQVGDEVLCAFVERARVSVRPSSDWIARYGGEEFAVVLPESDLGVGMAVAERIRVACAQRPLETSVGAVTVTVSFGVAALDHSAPASAAVDMLLREADAALYRSKRAGRNRVTSAT